MANLSRREAILGAIATACAAAMPGVPVLLADAPLSPATLTISEMVARYWAKRVQRAFVLSLEGVYNGHPLTLAEAQAQAMIDFPTHKLVREFSPLGTWE